MFYRWYFPLSFQSLSYSALIELVVAKRNEKWMRSQGAFEAGAAHYPVMVAMHIAFFISLIAEVFVVWQVAVVSMDFIPHHFSSDASGTDLVSYFTRQVLEYKNHHLARCGRRAERSV